MIMAPAAQADRRRGNAATDVSQRAARRDRLLLALLPHVGFDGWTDRALAAGAQDCGETPASVQRLFPGGMTDVVAHFSGWADRRMAEDYAGRDTADMRLRDRVALAVRLRLDTLAPHREAVRRSLAWLALPPNAPLAARCVWHTVDAIWHAVGDRSSDFSFYTKRGLLAGVLTTTTLYWLDDDSEDSRASWSFLDRRIGDVLRVPRLAGRVQRLTDRLPRPSRILSRLRGRYRP